MLYMLSINLWHVVLCNYYHMLAVIYVIHAHMLLILRFNLIIKYEVRIYGLVARLIKIKIRTCMSSSDKTC